MTVCRHVDGLVYERLHALGTPTRPGVVYLAVVCEWCGMPGLAEWPARWLLKLGVEAVSAG